jgi:nicotinate phosphoribosyltransferase
MTRRRTLAPGTPGEDLLVPVVRRGRPVREAPPLEASRERTRAQLSRLHAGIKRFVYPHQYPVGLERSLHDLRTRLVLEGRAMSA